MKLQITQSEGHNTFTAYGQDYVSVNSVRYTCNLIVLPDHLIPEWTNSSFETLSIADFEFLASLDSEIILLGTGAQIRFPHPELTQALIQARKGLEVMTTQAACRTYNILISEGRKATAALLIP